jgi:hypothetical protein
MNGIYLARIQSGFMLCAVDASQKNIVKIYLVEIHSLVCPWVLCFLIRTLISHISVGRTGRGGVIHIDGKFMYASFFRMSMEWNIIFYVCPVLSFFLGTGCFTCFLELFIYRISGMLDYAFSVDLLLKLSVANKKLNTVLKSFVLVFSQLQC